MRTYLVATAAITGFYPGLVQAQSVNPSGMSLPNFQVESLMTGKTVQGEVPPFVMPQKPAPRIIAADARTVKPVTTTDSAAAPQK
jgi:hypothetical protein